MKKMKKRIPIQPLLPKSPRAQPAPQLPAVPRALLDEADHLFNVRLNGPGSLLEHLALAYAFLDKVNRELVSSFTTCSQGCSHCCRMDVQITTFEAEYIVMATGIPHAPTAKLTKGHKGPCPFLSNAGECSIYAYRPLFCRTYHSLSDPKLCGIPGAAVAQYGSMESNMGNILYRGAASWVHFQNQHVTGGVKDIRDFFPHAPSTIHRHLAAHPPRLPF
ncbi:YkgJ family cysteine cluster protein [Burkholderia pseudomallei]|uniref:YkgJ family cysteine cluster protein n=1 Tax=Burkholderia pseudomallei TaxID=28450 RepID=UPI0010606652|nr:YkgJ family cysteine cluster protein [Burkholderia pseudomallei]MDA0559683.1 YkgJ family cysteine cluster protein [Burkholderia pseudomallei]